MGKILEYFKCKCLALAGLLLFFVGCSDHTLEAPVGPNIFDSMPQDSSSPLSSSGETKPLRVGPVSAYGQLMAGHPTGVGRIYGSCYGVVPGFEVQVRGMSLYWSIRSNATMFFSRAGISSMVRDMKIEIVRMAIATDDIWEEGIGGFILDPGFQTKLIDDVIKAAVENDIYVIIDWHSHHAEEQLTEAAGFFDYMAKTYGHLNNVIFEVYNEPIGPTNTADYWNTVQAYASYVVHVIRQYSDNLVIVGTPRWDQATHVVVNNPVLDPNVAYSFHYYANTHGVKMGGNPEKAMAAGYSVFVSEWGTADADGDGVPGVTANNNWQNWINANKLSWANWSASKIPEGTAAFANDATPEALTYTASGELVKLYLSTNPEVYPACPNP